MNSNKLNKTILLLAITSLIGALNVQGFDMKKDYPQHCIQTGVERGDVERIKEGIKLGASVHQGMYDGRYLPLHSACSRGHFAVVKFLIEEEGVDVDMKALDETFNNNWQNWKPNPSEKIEIVKLLLDHKNINIQDNQENAEKAFSSAFFWVIHAIEGCKIETTIAEMIARKKPNFYIGKETYDNLKRAAKHCPNKAWYRLFMRFDDVCVDGKHLFDSEGSDLYYAFKAEDIEYVIDSIENEKAQCHEELMTLFDENYGKFSELYKAIVFNDLDKVTEIFERSSNYFGYWGSCTPNKKLALEFAQALASSKIYEYLCKAWGIPSDDSWKSKAINVMDWICYMHPDGK